MSIIDMGKTFIEGWMQDQCIIYRDDEFTDDDVLDLDTGQLIRPEEDERPIYEGPCMTLGLNRKELSYWHGEAVVERKLFKTMLPTSVSQVQNGDIFVLTSAYNDQYLVGLRMRLTEIDAGTHRTYRKFLLERISDDRSSTQV